MSTPHAGGDRTATILVIDDKEDNRLLIRHLFDTPDYRVIEAPDGVRGLELAHAERPDCILLDLEMPELGGFEVLERLERDPQARQIPVIILTASDERLDTMERALRGGAVDYITKPISPLRIAIRVRGAIERGRLLKEVEDLRASFTSMLVHDLRGPLTVITAYLDMLQQPATGALTDTQRRYLQKMKASTARMIQLIGEILDLSKLEAGRLALTLQPMDLAAVVALVLESGTGPVSAPQGQPRGTRPSSS